MASAVGDHGVAQATFAVQLTKQESETAVEQEASRKDHGGISKELERCG